MSVVRIPPVLRANTAGLKQIPISGATVDEVLTALVATYPRLRSQLLTDDGDVNTFVNLFVNDTDIRHLDGIRTEVSDRDQLVILPAMAGGSR